MFKMRLIFSLSLLILVICNVFGGKMFRLGRGIGGNLGSPVGYNGEKLPDPRWFKQKLDHSSRTNNLTWKQRFFVNDQFYDYNDPAGPVFLMIGGEGPLDPRWMVKGAWIEYAQTFKALCISLEHRYYGESHPTEDTNTKNLKYLSSYQAISDVANFVAAMNIKFKFKSDVKWVAFGGSYPGSLAAWTRVKFPHLVSAAVSSSGPLLAKPNFIEYYEGVVNSLREKTGGDQCVNDLVTANNQIMSYIKEKPSVVEEAFKVCKPFLHATIEDLRNFFNYIADDFADLVQYNEDNRIGSDPRYENLTINMVCDMLSSDKPEPAYKKLAAFNAIILAKSNQTCMDYSYDNMIKELRNVSWGEGGRQWTYQTCTEFGFYQTSSGAAKAFGNLFPIEFFIKQCQDIFGKKFDETFLNAAVTSTNIDYGGLDISVSRVVFVHGTVDPWHALGVTTTRSNDTPAILIKGTAHCANMYPSSDKDSSNLVAARTEIEQHLKSWLGQI